MMDLREELGTELYFAIDNADQSDILADIIDQPDEAIEWVEQNLRVDAKLQNLINEWRA